MDRKKELQKQYKEMKIEAGVFQIKNVKNQKIFIETSPNLRSIDGQMFMLKMGDHKNQVLQNEWNKDGEKFFEITILEVLKKQDNLYFNTKEELKKLKQKWLDELQPYDERGYHKEISK